MVEEQAPKTRTSRKNLFIGCGVLVAIIIILAVSIGTCLEGTAPEKPALTPNEQAYATTVADQSTTVGEVFTELGELFQNPQMGNDEWTLKVAAQLVTIRMVYDEAMELDPPSSMAEVHLKYTQAMKHFNDATYLITQGVDELDPSLLDEATQEILTGSQLLEEATQLVLEFKEAHE